MSIVVIFADCCYSYVVVVVVVVFMFEIIVAERVQRERLRDLAVFERLDGNPRKTSSDLAVKKVDSYVFVFEICCYLHWHIL